MNNIVFSGHQPNFLPYMGFFYKVCKSDVFVLDDDVQYSRGAYHNTNFIKVDEQKFRITVPVSYSHGDAINKVRINHERNWERKMLSTIYMNYSRAPYFDLAYDLIERNLAHKFEFLSDLNIQLIQEICNQFGFDSRLIVASKEFKTDFHNQARNVFQCEQLGGNIYLSGIGGLAYNDEQDYAKHGIKLVYSKYEPTRYRQRGSDFIKNLSVLDYIFNQGYKIPTEWSDIVETG